MMELYNTILYKPLFNAVIFLYNTLPGNDFGLAVIALTVIIKIIFFPLTVKTFQSQRALNSIQPKMKEIKERHKNDAQAQSAAIMNLYKEHKVNPLSGCLPLLIQLPILIALYQAFGAGFKPENFQYLYSFVTNPGDIQKISLGFLDISASNPVLALLTGASQYFQLKQNHDRTAKDSKNGIGPEKEIQALNKQMLYFFPIIIIIIGWKLPAGLLLYWLTTTAFSVAEQSYISRKYNGTN